MRWARGRLADEYRMDPKKRNMLTLGAVVVLLLAAAGLGMRGWLFPSEPDTLTPELRDEVARMQETAPPPPPEPAKPVFSKGARPVGGS